LNKKIKIVNIGETIKIPQWEEIKCILLVKDILLDSCRNKSIFDINKACRVKKNIKKEIFPHNVKLIVKPTKGGSVSAKKTMSKVKTQQLVFILVSAQQLSDWKMCIRGCSKIRNFYEAYPYGSFDNGEILDTGTTALQGFHEWVTYKQALSRLIPLCETSIGVFLQR